jgi:hypothetical protein
VNRRESGHLHGVENAEYVEFPFLGKIGCVGKKSE